MIDTTDPNPNPEHPDMQFLLHLKEIAPELSKLVADVRELVKEFGVVVADVKVITAQINP